MALKIIIDIIIVLIIGFGAFWGVKKGFIATLAKPVKFFASLILAIMLSTIVATYIVEPIVEEPITSQISHFLVEKCENATVENADERIPTVLKFAAGVVGINIKDITASTIDEYVSSLVSELSHPVVHIFSIIVSFAFLYLVLRLLFTLIFALINHLLNRGFIGVINKILGCVFTTLFAVIIAWAFVSVFDYALNLPFLSDKEWAMNFDGGYIYKFFKSISPIELLLSF